MDESKKKYITEFLDAVYGGYGALGSSFFKRDKIFKDATKTILDYRNGIKRIMATAGNPDAKEACRLIIKICRDLDEI